MTQSSNGSPVNDQELRALCERYIAQVTRAADLEALDALRVQALGKQGEISQLMKSLGKMPPDVRKHFGEKFNRARTEVQEAIHKARTHLEAQALEQRLQAERVDVTLPAPEEAAGRSHPLSRAAFEICHILKRQGFAIQDGPEIENDYYNFSALNIPDDHPAREEQDTFYLPTGPKGEKRLLRTQTSPVQIRTLEQHAPPLRVLACGRVFRSDFDQTHTPTFHQVEGLCVQKGIHFGHLKACIIEFCRTFFGIEDLQVRFRPSFFPFTEPSAEVDIPCARRDGKLLIGEPGDWLEVLGCGMVHPTVLRNCGVDPATYSGFAFGLGVERLAMLKYGIPDLRQFYRANAEWMQHFGFVASSGLTAGLTP